MARSIGLDRTRVIAAAAELADRDGLEALTLAKVAAHLGVRLPSLYNYVDGLDGMRRELALLGCRELAGVVTHATIGTTQDEAVVALAEAYHAYAVAHPGRYAATVRAPGPDDTELQQAAEQLIVILAKVLEPYQLGEEMLLHTIRALRSIVHGFVSLESSGGFGLPLSRDASFHYLISLFVAGLRATRTPGSAKPARRQTPGPE